MRCPVRCVVLALACALTGCPSRDAGFAVAVTIDPTALSVETIAGASALAISVSGAESWDNLDAPYALTDQLKDGSRARWLYRPQRESRGDLLFDVRLLDGTGASVAHGGAAATLDPQATVLLTIALAPTTPDPVKPLADGESCRPGIDICLSGFCVDGVCCGEACTEACVACNLPGHVGSCRPIADGDSPRHGACPKRSPNDPIAPCSYDGTCDGGGSCRLWPRGTQASTSTCAAGQYTPPDLCDGKGGKLQPPSISCAPFICNATGTQCFGPPCANSSVCVVGNMCDPGTGSCGQLNLGRTCTANNQCVSGFCVDGVCCDGACTGQCEACDADPLQLGRCLPVRGAPHENGGRRSACSGNGQGGCAGRCDESDRRACVYPPATTVCAEPTCSANLSTPRTFCDGRGSCTVPAATACAPANNARGICRGNTCGIECLSSEYVDCDGNAANGCEVNLKTDNEHCGACATSCTAVGQTCMNGSCRCPTGKRPCGGSCIDQGACCIPADCSCTPTSAGIDSECAARGNGRNYGFRCGRDPCNPVISLFSPTYAGCEAVCGIEKLCCPSR